MVAKHRVCAVAAMSMTWAIGPCALAAPAQRPPGGMAGQLIEHYHMQRVPQEGVWFSVSYVSDDGIEGVALPARYAGRKHASGNAILILATRRDFSALHRLQSDEVWHFYGGTPLDLLLLYPDGKGRSVTLGSDVLHGQVPQYTVPHGVWMGAAPRGKGNAYSFGGTQLAPAFDPVDFEIGYRDTLTRRYPNFAGKIAQLTRAEFAIAPTTTAAAPTETNAAPAGEVFSAEAVPSLTPATGVMLKELAGRATGHAMSTAVSVAKFRLSDGATSGRSLNRRGEEILLITQGSGSVTLNGKTVEVNDQSVVYIPAGEPHEIVADQYGLLEFYAVSVPAFDPTNYVPLK